MYCGPARQEGREDDFQSLPEIPLKGLKECSSWWFPGIAQAFGAMLVACVSQEWARGRDLYLGHAPCSGEGGTVRPHLCSVEPASEEGKWVKGGKVRNDRQELGGRSVGLHWENFPGSRIVEKLAVFHCFVYFPQSSTSRCWKGRQLIHDPRFNEECDSFTLNHGLAQLFQALWRGTCSEGPGRKELPPFIC